MTYFATIHFILLTFPLSFVIIFRMTGDTHVWLWFGEVFCQWSHAFSPVFSNILVVVFIRSCCRTHTCAYRGLSEDSCARFRGNPH